MVCIYWLEPPNHFSVLQSKIRGVTEAKYNILILTKII